MVGLTHIHLQTESAAAAETLVREYVLEALDRFQGRDDCEHITFGFDDSDDFDDRDIVVLVYLGDPEVFIDAEENRWEALVEDGLAESWEQALVVEEEEIGDITTDEEGKLELQLGRLSTDMACLAYEQLDTRPAAVDTFGTGGDEGSPIGWWSLLHILTHQQQYTVDEEIRAYEYGIEHALRNIAEHESPDAAEERLDELVESFESMREAVLTGRLE